MINSSKISILLLTLNEEQNIESALTSIKWADEVLIFDTGSKDRTLELIHNCKVKVYPEKFENNFAILRTKVLNKARCNWILVLDADERLDGNAEKKIRKLITNKEVNGYWFPRRQYVNEREYLKHGYFYPDYQLRLFRNHIGVKYSGKIHEQAIMKGKTVYVDDVEIYHNSSHTKFGSFFTIQRFFKYVAIEGKELANDKSISNFDLFRNITTEFMKHFFRCYFKLVGYKDGYLGFRGAILYSVYKSWVQGYALYKRII